MLVDQRSIEEHVVAAAIDRSTNQMEAEENIFLDISTREGYISDANQYCFCFY